MKKVILKGKIWEIRYLLKVYEKQYTYVSEWINGMDSNLGNRNVPKKQTNLYPISKEKTF
jgi:hypothetical protein